MRLIFLGLVVLGLTGCGGSDASEPEATDRTGESAEGGETAEAEGRWVDGFYVDEGAPDPLACTSDEECVAYGVLDRGGCCWSYRDMNAAVMSTAYRDWTNARRQVCDTAACPSPPVPTQPPDCLFDVRCADGRCANACE